MIPLTRRMPFCFEPRRQVAGSDGVEPSEAVLETVCSPRSTILSRVFERSRTAAFWFTARRARPLHYKHRIISTELVGRGVRLRTGGLGRENHRHRNEREFQQTQPGSLWPWPRHAEGGGIEPPAHAGDWLATSVLSQFGYLPEHNHKGRGEYDFRSGGVPRRRSPR